MEKNLNSDYGKFVDKFQRKLTTDDCYTPSEVYKCILKYVSEKFNLTDREIIRPFYPGGDYENANYPEGCVVVDNPPFSILSKIARYYLEQNIKFFLFAPHMTLFSVNIDCTAIVCGADIIYENGAKVKTSFLTNMLGNIRVMGAPDLYQELIKINNPKKNLPKYKYPSHVLTVSMVQKYVENGISIQLDKKEVTHCRGLDSQKNYKKALFGSGFLLSEKAAAKKLATEKLVVEKLVVEKDDVIIWELSDRERKVIDSLN